MKGRLFLVTLSLLLIIVPFWMRDWQFMRLILALTGLILLTFVLFFKKKKNIFKITFVFLSFFLELFLVDYLLVSFMDMPPILALKITSSNNMSNYDGIFYRTYNCNENQILDHFYREPYLCTPNLDQVSVNYLANSILTNFSSFSQKFFNIQGKISSIQGTNILELQGYEQTSDNLNGRVLFHNTITIQADFGSRYDLSNYKVYDMVNVIGRISHKKKVGDTTYIYLKDAILLENDLYETYELDYSEENICDNSVKLISATNEYNFYSTCLKDMYIRYDNENIYELSYVLTDRRMTLEKMTSNMHKVTDEVLTLYEGNDLNILKCQTNNVIIGTKDLNLTSKICEQFDTILTNPLSEEE